jgi:hypothetical protein
VEDIASSSLPVPSSFPYCTFNVTVVVWDNAPDVAVTVIFEVLAGVPPTKVGASFGENLATAVLHAVADLPLVNIQSDVIHRFHGGAPLVSLNQPRLSSAFLHQALLLRPIHSN